MRKERRILFSRKITSTTTFRDNMRAFILIATFLISFPAQASDRITHDTILDLLTKEKRFMQNRDASSLSNLFTEDVQFVTEKGDTLDKSSYMSLMIGLFMNSEAILMKPELIEEKVSEDGLTAEIKVRSEEKFLFVRGNRKAVSHARSVWRAIIVIDDGIAKYKYGEVLERK